ncbi:ParB/RepB/Spo0J family partition protein [Nevskia soli]|uniref:ParB/RepB/Spo0J family partition protein n=1 Tax=Nevskia soli TaxID=418856 RepID=UPI000691D137|nr:ParB/RepB/Spo0J family partition protein [Nevskia soli]
MDMRVESTAREITVPLNRLRPSTRNVRKSGGTSVKQLARSIDRVGLLQNLIVTDPGDEGFHEVEAGKRRLLALQLLAKRKRLPEDHGVRCLLVPDASATTVSLTENFQREAMHPADEFEAFKALVDEGRPIEDIAADFGVTPLTVQRRLKLANVSRRLLADYRKDKVTMEQLMALAVTDDHAAQEQAFYESPEWQRDPRQLREHLTAEDVNAERDAVARFVGVEDYQQAGGVSRRDLFAEGEKGVYLSDRALLDKLAVDRLAPIATDLELEGWAWIEVVPRATASDIYAFERVPTKNRKPTDKEAKQAARIEKRIEKIEATLEAGECDEGGAAVLEEEWERLDAEREALAQARVVYPVKAKAHAGVVVSVDNEGKAVVHRGLVREADAKQLRAEASEGGKAKEGEQKKADGKPEGSLSASLTRQLSAHRTAALQAELAKQPSVALVAVIHRLALQALYGDGHYGNVVRITCAPPERLERYAQDLPQSTAVTALNEAKQAWRDTLPAEPERLFAALREMPQEDLLALLAVCTACCVEAVTDDAADDRAGPLAAALDLDMARWWTPTAAGYFAHVPKVKIIEAVKCFSPDDAHQLDVMKKNELAATAERLSAGKNWLPDMLRKAA